jgi:signal transduction histidine kinase
LLLIQKSNPDYKIDIHFEEDFEDDNQISVNANEYLLKTAFVNLMENGCKFSPEKQMLVAIFFDKNGILVSFEDHGIGISEKDLERLFTPF